MSETRRLYLTTMGYVDLSEYLLKTEAETLYATIDIVNNKQDKLISGTNIKTINGNSLLGSGNITIEGGGSGGGSSAYPESYLRTSNTTMSISPNVFYVWDEVPSLTLTFSEGTSGVANEYLFQFTSGSTPTTLSLPNDIKWENDSAPTISENKIYQVSILKGLASVLEFKNSPSEIEFYVDGNLFNALSNMTWEEFINSDYNPDIYNDKMFIAGDYGNPKYAGSVYSEDDIEYYTIYTEGYWEVLLTDKILSTNYIIA